MKHSLLKLAAVALAAVVLPVVGVGVASAAPAEVAPNCVRAWESTPSLLTHKVSVRNDCSYRLRIKVVLSAHTDDRCRELDPGDGFSLTVARTADLDRVDRC